MSLSTALGEPSLGGRRGDWELPLPPGMDPTCNPFTNSSQPCPPVMPDRFPEQADLRGQRAPAGRKSFGTTLNHSGMFLAVGPN